MYKTMSDTPAPLSADSLRELKNQIFDRVRDAQSGIDDDDIKLSLARLATKEIMQLHAAALQSERQRIADSLPEKRTIDNDHEYTTNTFNKGFNEAIEAVRVVLIPPTPEDKTINATFYKTDLDAGLGGLDKPSEPAEPKGTKSITGASASEEER